MLALVLGLALFLGIHSIRIVADDWRTGMRARVGEKPWKLGYTAVSIVGFVLICWGYGQARQAPVVLWETPPGMNHLAAALTLVAFVFLAASKVPRNAIKARLRHPMLLGTKVWALAHLLANNTLADLLLFGGFLVWAILCFRAARRRDIGAAPPPPPSSGTAAGTATTVVVGIALWAAFALWLHALLIGVRPL